VRLSLTVNRKPEQRAYRRPEYWKPIQKVVSFWVGREEWIRDRWHQMKEPRQKDYRKSKPPLQMHCSVLGQMG
jgi:hypothetical protein